MRQYSKYWWEMFYMVYLSIVTSSAVQKASGQGFKIIIIIIWTGVKHVSVVKYLVDIKDIRKFGKPLKKVTKSDKLLQKKMTN